MRSLTLLGPQRLQPIIAHAVDRLAGEGPLAIVTAGWQEREEEVDELADHVQRPITNLRLHGRAEEVFQASPELFEALRARQDQLKLLQRLHRLRLDYALEPARRLLRQAPLSTFLEEEQESAVEAVRALDDHHAARIREIHQDFEGRWQDSFTAALKGHRQELLEVLEKSAAIAIAGGHVAVLLNRLRLFDLPNLVGDLPIVAWSAGAMALADRIVLFHDRPPQGAGNAEILDLGLGLAPAVVPLPHAQSRLRLDDPVRVALLARRFSPAACVALDRGSSLTWNGQSWTAGEKTQRLLPTGAVEEFEVLD